MPAVKTTALFAQFSPRLCGYSLLFILLTFQARAHDPGLSTATITVENEQIAVLLGFAQKDIESMLASGPNVADTDAAKGFAATRSELESVAANEFSLYWGRQRAIPDGITARRKDIQNIEISLLFQRRNSGELRVVSTLFERLPLGHRQFLLKR